MSTEANPAPEKLKIGETTITLIDSETKVETEYETVGKMSFDTGSGEKDLFVNAFVPMLADGKTQDESKEIEYVVTDEEGNVIEDEDVQEHVTKLFVAEVMKEEDHK